MSGQHDSTSFLEGARLLIVEDEPLIAIELQDLLEQRGAAVLGPTPSVQTALAAIESDRPDAALLDVNLRGVRSTPVASVLLAASIPFLLVTGYSRSQLPDPELRKAPIVPKPVIARDLWRTLDLLLQTHR